ncbi:uncharacterized protein K02A2.6-like [Topomyia yanbarensis]|uniref:uncharacterized protein K02A2.6-like n=1 Tax=Topomyia yanbarensis TaxID=2498891 RepID=UPI00273CED4F|nr:uncharacterized protein K02A2.6-like [Topomyia yanbarensis]
MAQPQPELAAGNPIVINSSIPFPESLKLDGNLRENVELWKDAFETYIIASGVEGLSERVKIATFKSALGPDARKIFNLWPLDEGERNTVAACLESLSTHLIPQKNVKLARYEFNQCRQEPEDSSGNAENMTSFINRARALVKDCQYGNLEDEMLRDKIITGIRDMHLKKKMIETDNLTSARVIEMCRAEEATRAEMERNQWLETLQPQSLNNITGGYKLNKRCSFCGRAYHKNLQECPARGASCNYCGVKNHYEAVCKKKKEESKQSNFTDTCKKRNRKKVNTVEETEQLSESLESESDQESVTMCQYLYSLKQKDDTLLKTNLTFLDANKGERLVQCILDSGATCNVIGASNAKKIIGDKRLRLDNQHAILKVFGGGRIRSLGRTTIDCVHNGVHYKAIFHVVDFEQMPLLSMKTCLQLKLIQLCFSVIDDQRLAAKQILNKFSGVFVGLGKLEGRLHLDVDKTIQPVVQQPRRIAVTLREELRQELERLEKLGVIAEEKRHTDWVSNLVLVKRSNKLRVYIDPVMLNKALERPHFQMPTLDELLPELANAKVFTTVDAKSGFWQIELDEESSKLTTCWTPFGRYRWLRMPMGIAPAPEVFQLRANEIIHGLRNVNALMDDFMIFGCGETMTEAMIDHNRNLEAFLERMSERNMRLNPDKIKLCQETVKYFGHILTSSGVKPDPDKTNSILNIPQPKDVAAIQRFLGMVTYLAHYLPSLSTVAEPLRRLTIKDQPWIWSREQNVAFERLKQMVSTAPVLRYFDVTKNTIIQCDSSSVGLGAVLLQDGHPVVYASKTRRPLNVVMHKSRRKH